MLVPSLRTASRPPETHTINMTLDANSKFTPFFSPSLLSTVQVFAANRVPCGNHKVGTLKLNTSKMSGAADKSGGWDGCYPERPGEAGEVGRGESHEVR